MMIGSLFQTIVMVGLAHLLGWSLLGVGGIVFGGGYFIASCYWKWKTSRHLANVENSLFSFYWHFVFDLKYKEAVSKYTNLDASIRENKPQIIKDLDDLLPFIRHDYAAEEDERTKALLEDSFIKRYGHDKMRSLQYTHAEVYRSIQSYEPGQSDEKAVIGKWGNFIEAVNQVAEAENAIQKQIASQKQAATPK